MKTMGRTKEYYAKALRAGRFVTVASSDDYSPAIFWIDENEAGQEIVKVQGPHFGTITHTETVEQLAKHFVSLEKNDGFTVIVGGWTH